MIRHTIVLGTVLGLVGCLMANDGELLPPPRVVENPLKFEKIQGGYQVTLGRINAERLLSQLKGFNKEAEVGEVIKAIGEQWSGEESAATLSYLLQVVTKETPKFKKTLEEKMGPNGVIIRVYGVDTSKPRPVLKAIGKAFLPKEVQDQARGVIAAINTKGLLWSVEPRE